MRVRVTYFKSTGKWYGEAVVDIPTEYSWEIKDHLVQGRLPGLESGRWDGVIHVVQEKIRVSDPDPVPRLLFPEDL